MSSKPKDTYKDLRVTLDKIHQDCLKTFDTENVIDDEIFVYKRKSYLLL